MRGNLVREGALFGLSGIANVSVGLALYQALLFVVPYPWAYTISFAAGAGLAAILNVRLTFSAPLTVRNVTVVVGLYLVQYTVGLAATVLLVQRLDIPPRATPFILLLLLTPLSFIGARVLVGRDRSQAD